MVRVGLDTSVVVRLLVGEPLHQAVAAKKFLDEILATGKTAVVSDLVVSEVYFALCYHYSISKKNALMALKHFLNSGQVETIGVAAEVLEAEGLASANPGFVDCVIHQQYLKVATHVATFEKSAKKLMNVILLK